MIKDNQTDWHWSKYEGDRRYNNYWSHFHLSTNLQHNKRKKHLSQSVYCISITGLPSNNSFKVHVRKKILWKYWLLITLSAMKTFPTCKEKKYIYLIKIFIVQVLQGWLVTIHLRFVIGTNKKYFVVIIDNTFIFQLQNISSMQREKNISVKVFIV